MTTKCTAPDVRVATRHSNESNFADRLCIVMPMPVLYSTSTPPFARFMNTLVAGWRHFFHFSSLLSAM